MDELSDHAEVKYMTQFKRPIRIMCVQYSIILLCLWSIWGNFIVKVGLYRLAWPVDVSETSQCKLRRENVSLSVTCHHMGGGAVLIRKGLRLIYPSM